MAFQSYSTSRVGQNGFVSSGVYGNQQPINGNRDALQQQYIIEQENVDPHANSGWNQNQQAVIHYAHNGSHCHQIGVVSNVPLERPQWNGHNQNQQWGIVQKTQNGFVHSGLATHRNLPNDQSLEIPSQQNLPLPCASVNVPSTRRTRQGKPAQFGDLAYVNEYEAHRLTPFTLNRASTNQTFSAPFDIYLSDQQHWMKFHEQTNEMMLVNQGRNIFPQIGFNFNRMDPTAEYILGIKLELRSPNKFEYDNGVWKEGDSVVSADSNELFSVPLHGAALMKDGFAFKDLKIFNIGDERKKGKNSKTGMQEDQLAAAQQEDLERARRMLLVVLRCKYRPLLTVYQVDQWGQIHQVHTASFEETTFIVCTKYKSKTIRDMKSMNNKFVRADAKRKCDQPLRSTCQAVPSFIHRPQEIPIVPQFAPMPATQIMMNPSELLDYPPPNFVPCHSTAPPPIVPTPPLCSPLNARSTSSGNSPPNSVDSLNSFPPLHPVPSMNPSVVWDHCAPSTSSNSSPPNSVSSLDPPLSHNSPQDANQIEGNNYQVNISYEANGEEDDAKYDDPDYWLVLNNE